MAKRAAGDSGWAAAALLGALTLAVFFILQNYGPESAVRRLHEAILRQDPGVFSQVVQEPLGSEPSQAVAAILVRLVPAADSYKLVTMDRQVSEARLGMAYLRRGRLIGSILWVVDKRGSRTWRINATKTIALMQEYGAL
ncbi:MAG: hypothetical protein WAO58_03835 [Fimbriimonadaceae bacterium]